VLAVVSDSLLSVQAIEGHLPALFYPRVGTPERVLGIAIGSGQSFGAMLMYPIKRMDVVDISSEMIELSLTRFKEYNHNLGTDPRVTIHLDDGRHFVERAPADYYDVVSMEPPPPTAEGVHALYSLEFYQSIERVMRADGVLMQWVPLYWLTPNEARSLVKTQAQVFPYTFILRTGPVDFMTLSFKRNTPPQFSTSWLEERARVFAQERLVSARRWRLECKYDTASLEGILALINAGPEDVARLEAPYIYEDDDQRLSYSSGDRELLRRYPWDRLVQFSFAALPLTPFSELQQYFVEPILVRELDAERARALLRYDVPDPAEVEETENRYQTAGSPLDRMSTA
jgi:spermidine synthase